MRLFQLSIAGAVLLVACGCGGGSGITSATPTRQPALTSGNWVIVLLPPSNPPPPANLGGSLMQQGNSISGIIHANASLCFDPLLDDLVVSGSADGQNVTFSTAPVHGQVITVTGTVQNAGSTSGLKGTYTFSGSNCIAATGTVAGLLLPPLTGTFTGPVTGTLTANATATVAQSGPDGHGFFHLFGTFSFSGTPCFTSGTIASSSLSGLIADFVLNTSDGGQTNVAGLNSLLGLTPNLDASLFVQSGACPGFFGNAILAKQ